jgi:hypothetical protein
MLEWNVSGGELIVRQHQQGSLSHISANYIVAFYTIFCLKVATKKVRLERERGFFSGFFSSFYIRFSTLLHLPPLRLQRMLGPNPRLLRLWHWQPIPAICACQLCGEFVSVKKKASCPLRDPLLWAGRFPRGGGGGVWRGRGRVGGAQLCNKPTRSDTHAVFLLIPAK